MAFSPSQLVTDHPQEVLAPGIFAFVLDASHAGFLAEMSAPSVQSDVR
jgi:hypothetical protein